MKGGKVYGDWPGLKDHQLHEGRDLALTTDFRDVFAEVAMRHLGVEDPAGIFPGYAVSPARFRGIPGLISSPKLLRLHELLDARNVPANEEGGRGSKKNARGHIHGGRE